MTRSTLAYLGAAFLGLTVAQTAAQEVPAILRPPVQVSVPDEGVEVPIVAMAPSPVVEVLVNGEGPFRFMLDTGGQGMARADVSLVERLNLPVTGQVQAGDGTGQGTVAMNLVRLDTLRIGDAEFHGLEAGSRDYNPSLRPGGPIDGVLGIGLFADYLLTIDFPGERIRFAPGVLPEPDGLTVLSSNPDRAVPTIPVTVGEHTVEADLDTGSMGSLLLPQALADDLPLTSPLTAAGQARTVSNQFTIYSASIGTSARLGRHEFATPTVMFSDLFTRANIGADLLKHFAVTIDQRNSTVRLDRAAETPLTLAPQRRMGLMMAPAAPGAELRVLDVVADSPAARAGIEAGDVLVAVGGRPVEQIPAAKLGGALIATDPVVVTVRRGAEVKEVSVRFEGGTPHHPRD
jgi:predicted aspartyl protease